MSDSEEEEQEEEEEVVQKGQEEGAEDTVEDDSSMAGKEVSIVELYAKRKERNPCGLFVHLFYLCFKKIKTEGKIKLSAGGLLTFPNYSLK